MKARILKALKEKKDYISGQALAAELNVSRTAVWKAIKQLEQDGYLIEAVPNKGYRLTEQADVLSAEELEYIWDEDWLVNDILYFDQVDSTNIRAKQLAEQGAPDRLLVVAQTQTAGKGRRGKGWVSPKGSGIWMSLILRPELEPGSASMLTLAAALAVSKGIETVSGLKTQVKWPNDIVINGKKVCGILTEMSSELNHIYYVIIGIGINVNMSEFPEEIRSVATSCLIEGKKELKRALLIAAVMKELKYYYELFLQQKDLSLFMDDYQSRLANIGKEVTVIGAKESFSGIAMGIDRTGELLVQMEDKSIRKVVSGEVSVRGIYGYV